MAIQLIPPDEFWAIVLELVHEITRDTIMSDSRLCLALANGAVGRQALAQWEEERRVPSDEAH